MEFVLIGVFVLLITVAHVVAVSSVMKYWRLANLGLNREITTPFPERVKNVLINAILQKKLLQLSVRGIFHMFIFYGFLVYLCIPAAKSLVAFLAPLNILTGRMVTTYTYLSSLITLCQGSCTPMITF